MSVVIPGPKIFQGVCCQLSTNLAIPDRTYYPLHFNSVVYDPLGMHGGVPAPSRFTLPEWARLIRVNWTVRWQGPTVPQDGTRVSAVYVDGVQLADPICRAEDTPHPDQLQSLVNVGATPVFEVSGGNEIRLYAYQSNSANVSLNVSSRCIGIEIVG